MGTTIALTITANDDGSAVIQNFSVNAVKAFRQAEAASNDAVQKIKNGWNSLKGAWVEIAASIYTLKKAWDVADMAAQFEEQMGSINRLAAQYNTSAASIVGGIQEVSKGMVSLADAADIAGDLMLKRLRPEQIINLASAAETLSNVTGEKVTKSFKEMAEAVATGRTKALESVLGVIDLKERYGDLAGKLTEAEKVQAIYNIVMERTRRVQLQLGDSADTYGDKMERLTTTVKDLNLHLGTVFLRVAAGSVGIFQWLSAGIMAFYSNLVKVVSYGFWVLSKLSITKEARDDAAALYQSLKTEASAMDEGAQDLIGKALQSFEAAFAKSGDLSAAMKAPSLGTSGGPDITKAVSEAVDSQLEMVGDELKAEPPSLDVAIKLNPRLMEGVDKYWDEVDAALKEATKHTETINAEFYAATGVISDEYFKNQVQWIKDVGEAWKKMGIEAVAVEKWVAGEIKNLTQQKAKEDKTWIDQLQEAVDAVANLTTGSSNITEGMPGQIGEILKLISSLANLPKLISDFLKDVFTNLRNFPREMINLLTDVVFQLPTIVTEIIVAFIDGVDDFIWALVEGIPAFVEGLIKLIPTVILAIVREIPQVIEALVEGIPLLIENLLEGIWEGITMLFTGGTLESTIDSWTEDTAVTVELDTTEAMNALMYAQDALLGALNDTDRAVAREALLSAREAAILAEKASDSTVADAAQTFEGLFDGWLGDLWDTIVDAFNWVWEGLVNVFEWFFETIWGVFTWAGDLISDVLSWAWNGLVDVFEWAWNALTDVFEWFADTLSDLFDWLGDLLSDAWDYIAGGNGENGIADDWFGYGEWWSFHQGGAIKKAHSGLYIGSGLGSQEVPIIAKVGEGILNDYNGMRAIGGEAGLNYVNAHGSLPGGASQTFVTQHQYFKVVVDKDGNTIKLTKTQAKNLARTLGPALEEMQRDGELALA